MVYAAPVPGTEKWDTSKSSLLGILAYRFAVTPLTTSIIVPFKLSVRNCARSKLRM
jgi:hypothetical protein